MRRSRTTTRTGEIAANLGFIRTGASYKRKLGKSLYTLAPSLGTNILTLYTKDYDYDSTIPKILDISRRWYLFGTRGEWLRDDAHGFLHAGLDIDGGYLGRVSQYDRDDVGDDSRYRATRCCGRTQRSSSRRAGTGIMTSSRCDPACASIAMASASNGRSIRASTVTSRCHRPPRCAARSAAFISRPPLRTSTSSQTT